MSMQDLTGGMVDSAVIPGLPDDLALRCLAYVPWQCQGPLIAVCRRWYHLFLSGTILKTRKDSNISELLLGLGEVVRVSKSNLRRVICEAFNPNLINPDFPFKPRLLPSVPMYSGLSGPAVSGFGASFVPSLNPRLLHGERAGELWEYHVATNGWTHVSFVRDLEQGLCKGRDGKVYGAGGLRWSANQSAFVPTKAAECVDPATGVTVPLPAMKRARCGCTVLSDGGKVYVVGGLATGEDAVNNVEVYDTVECMWESRTVWELPHDYTFAFRHTILDGQLYCVQVSHVLEGGAAGVVLQLVAYELDTGVASKSDVVLSPFEAHTFTSCQLISMGTRLYLIGKWRVESSAALTFDVFETQRKGAMWERLPITVPLEECLNWWSYVLEV